jgi:hypothetical protein
MRLTHSIALTGLIAAPAAAAKIDLTVTIPQIRVAEYHRPYVAVWIEGASTPARTLAVWYDVAKRNGEGQKWLQEVRTWWRKSGRSLKLPADGVSGATRAPGPQKILLDTGNLPAGSYDLVIEAARETGGREAVRLPITLKSGTTAKAAGTTELGVVSATVK